MTHWFSFACYFLYIFLLYDIINCQQSSLGYLLLTKRNFWGETYAKVNTVILFQLKAIKTEIKKIDKYINPNIITRK